MEVIDYARYLSLAASTDSRRGRFDEGVDYSEKSPLADSHVRLLSDQKNFLEELNRHFEVKLKDSQSK